MMPLSISLESSLPGEDASKSEDLSGEHSLPGDNASEPEDLSGEHPEHETNAVGGLVVTGDSNINKLKLFSYIK